jgi:hypothetical protein
VQQEYLRRDFVVHYGAGSAPDGAA